MNFITTLNACLVELIADRRRKHVNTSQKTLAVRDGLSRTIDRRTRTGTAPDAANTIDVTLRQTSHTDQQGRLTILRMAEDSPTGHFPPTSQA